jgi:hypothetical protein
MLQYNELERIPKEMTQLLSCNLPRGADENHKNFSPDSQCPGRDSYRISEIQVEIVTASGDFGLCGV